MGGVHGERGVKGLLGVHGVLGVQGVLGLLWFWFWFWFWFWVWWCAAFPPAFRPSTGTAQPLSPVHRWGKGRGAGRGHASTFVVCYATRGPGPSGAEGPAFGHGDLGLPLRPGQDFQQAG